MMVWVSVEKRVRFLLVLQVVASPMAKGGQTMAQESQLALLIRSGRGSRMVSGWEVRTVMAEKQMTVVLSYVGLS